VSLGRVPIGALDAGTRLVYVDKRVAPGPADELARHFGRKPQLLLVDVVRRDHVCAAADVEQFEAEHRELDGRPRLRPAFRGERGQDVPAHERLRPRVGLVGIAAERIEFFREDLAVRDPYVQRLRPLNKGAHFVHGAHDDEVRPGLLGGAHDFVERGFAHLAGFRPADRIDDTDPALSSKISLEAGSEPLDPRPVLGRLIPHLAGRVGEAEIENGDDKASGPRCRVLVGGSRHCWGEQNGGARQQTREKCSSHRAPSSESVRTGCGRFEDRISP
jgi:hypothetical protein